MKCEILEIPIERIKVDPELLPREDYGDIESLKQSIQRKGLIERPIVTPTGEGIYQMISGARRLKALVSIGEKLVSCFVEGPMDKDEIEDRAFTIGYENKSFTSIEIAKHFGKLKNQRGYSLRQIEVKCGCSPAKISQYLKLLDLPKSVQDLIASGRLTLSHGIELSKLSNPKHQERMAKQAIDFGWSANKTGAKVDSFIRKEKQTPLENIMIPDGNVPGDDFLEAKYMSEQANESVHLIVISLIEKDINPDENRAKIDAEGAEISRMMVPGGIIVINASNNYNYRGPNGNNKEAQVQLVDHNLKTILGKLQFSLIDIIICGNSASVVERDTKIPHTQHRIGKKFEQLLVFRKKGERELPTEDIIQRSLISDAEWGQLTTGIWMIDEASAFSAEEIVRRLVRMYSYEGDVVLDPFLGSGTTVKVARELGRQAYGYERLEQHKEVIMKKLGIEPAPKQHSMADHVKRSLALNKPVATDSFLEPSAESKSCKPRFICSEGFADSLFINR